MTPILIGYFPKRRTPRPDSFRNMLIEEICSVSNCICEEPKGWIDHWRHNEMLVYDTPELAWGIVSEAERANFAIHAYRIFLVIFESGTEEPLELPSLQAQSLPDTFELLGYDAVSQSWSDTFECSPLSCNGMADEVVVNRYCLMDDKQTAFQTAAVFAKDEPEPGPYYVVEVWRERRAG